MYVLTDGTEKSPLLGFCKTLISEHQDKWPPAEDVLAREFVGWLRPSPLLTRDRMTELCQSKGVNLSFTTLPSDVRGFNCAFHYKKEIVISTNEVPPFSDLHTLFHEFRELLEHEFAALRRPTIGKNDSLEQQAEIFAMACRMEAGIKELPAIFDIVQQVEKKWARYLSYALLVALGVFYIFDCIYLPQIEESISEAKHQRYVRM